MCRSKKTIWMLALLFVLSCTACTTSESTDADTTKENYLNTAVLNQQTGQIGSGQYQIYTLEKGTFTEEAMSQTLERAYINATIAYAELPCEEAHFGYYIADYFRYVDKGDVLATFYADVDTVALEQAELQLQRLQERYARAETDHADRAEELRVQQITEPDGYGKQIIAIQREQEELEWEKSKKDYERSMEDAEKSIKELQETGNLIEVYAPAAGLVIPTEWYATGQKVEDGAYLCHIIPVDEYYVSTDKKTDAYNYGMKLTFNTRAGAATGTVIGGDSKILYGNLDSQEIIFRIETNETVTQSDLDASRGLSFTGNVKTVENVILVPKTAVTEENSQYYVIVLQEDGSLLKTEFIPGGSNGDFYWVFNGLTEGMQIISK